MNNELNTINPNMTDYYLTLRHQEHGERTSHPKKKKKAPKERPNFFIAIQVTDTTISTGIQQVQDHIKTRLPDLAPKDFIKLHKLHITAFVLCIKSHDVRAVLDRLTVHQDLHKVVSVIEKSKEIATQFFPNGTLPAIGLQGVRSFEGHRVIWIDLEQGNEKDLLRQYVGMSKLLMLLSKQDTLHQFFKDNLPEVGFEEKKFIPHITLFKARRKGKHNKVHPEHYEPFKAQLFGRQPVEHLMLVAMEEEEPLTRFYKCVCKYDFASSSCVVVNDPSTFYFRKRKLSSSSDEPAEKRHEGEEHTQEISNNANNNNQNLLKSSTGSTSSEDSQPIEQPIVNSNT